jgi:Rrf2 family protein
MLRISKKADYAVFLLGCIAREGAYPGGPHEEAVVSAQEIARQAGLNKSVVANLLKGLAREGLLESQRGLKGGYRLSRHPAEISLARVLGVVDGPFHLEDCVRHLGERKAEDPHTCSLISFCSTKNPMRVVHQRIAGMFEQIRLDELCGLVPFQTETPAGAHR